MTGSHDCFAYGCFCRVPSHMLMCRRHWAMVPQDIKQKVWAEFRAKGSAFGSEGHLQACQEARDAVARQEGKLPIGGANGETKIDL